MNSLQIKYFMGAVECRSMSKAAESFFISQPAISKHIGNLEQELGVTLLKRSSVGVSLTDAGKLIYDYFATSTQGFGLVLSEAKRLSDSAAGTLRLGVPEDWDVSKFALSVKPRFSALHPNVSVSTACQNNLMTLVSRLKDHFFDVLFLPFVPSPHMEGITALRLTEVPMTLLVSRENHLCGRETLKPEDFEDELFLVTGHGGFDIAKRSMYKYLEPYRFAPRIETRTSMSSVILGVLNNEGVTLRDVWSLSVNNPNLRCVELASTQSVYLAFRTDDDNPALKDFVRLVREHFQSAEKGGADRGQL